MLKSLLKELHSKESLKSIGHLGKACQSSQSKWSKENDAQRAVVENEYNDFAFHTAKEVNPWWEIEFKLPVNLEYIIINNRKRSPFDEIASNLSIVAYDKESRETLLHMGTVYFGSEPQGCPLIIPLKSKVSVKRLKITLLKEDYLHLSNINLLVADPLGSFNDKPVFIANRADGLGERLRTLLNSMVLAKKTDGHFIFSWPTSFSANEFHSIDKPENIFSHDFIESYLVDREMLNRCELKSLEDIQDIKEDLQGDYRKIGVTLDQKFLKNQINDKNIHIERIGLEYRLAFERIDFNKIVTKAINLARSVKLRNNVLGIHLRTGDIVYGKYRYMDRYHNKVVPFYTVETIVTRYLNMGYEIVLFSQDNEACKYFKNKYGVLLSSDLIPEDYNDVQRAIFDIVLMSRCKEIVGGSSGFSIVASWIGGSRILNYKNLLSEAEIKSSFIGSLEDKGVLSSNLTLPLLKSFSIIHYLQSFKDYNSVLERITLLKECIIIDPTNNFYRLLLALDYYEENDFEAADNILLDIIKSKDMTNIKWLAETKFPKTTILSEYTLEFERYAMQGSIVAAYVAFLSRYYYDELDMNNSFYQEIIEKSPENIVDIELLEEIQQKLTLRTVGQ